MTAPVSVNPLATIYVDRLGALDVDSDLIALCDDVLGLLIEYRDRHGHDEATARTLALNEIAEGLALARELARHARPEGQA